jgi:hypothetical protein
MDGDIINPPSCKTCSMARIFVTPQQHVFVILGNAWEFYEAGSEQAVEHVRRMQASALNGVLQMALANGKKGA